MKIIKRTVSLLLSGVIIALGFCGCKTPKSVIRGEQQLENKRAELSGLNQQIAERYAQIAQLKGEIKEIIEKQNVQKVVYGPPPVPPTKKP